MQFSPQGRDHWHISNSALPQLCVCFVLHFLLYFVLYFLPADIANFADFVLNVEYNNLFAVLLELLENFLLCNFCETQMEFYRKGEFK